MSTEDTERIWNSRHAVHYESHIKFAGERLRVQIQRDTYDFQSFATLDIYDPGARVWNQLASIPYPEMASLGNRGMSRDYDPELFHKDEQELLGMAETILSGKR